MSIRVEHISYIYGKGSPFEKTALDDVDLTIEKGEFIGIIGHTGSGKSTLIQHLNCGKVTIDGVDLAEKSKAAVAKRHSVGMVFQYPEHQLFEETVAKDIAFGPMNLGCDEEEAGKRVKSAMKFAGLDYDTFAGRSPFRLSGGQQRRVAIAGVIAMHPDFLILDEPSAGLDPIGRREILPPPQRRTAGLRRRCSAPHADPPLPEREGHSRAGRGKNDRRSRRKNGKDAGR